MKPQEDTTGSMMHNKEEKYLKEFAPVYSESKEEIWTKLSDKIVSHPDGSKPNIGLTYRMFRLVASILLLISITLFARLYKNETLCKRGEIIEFQLPDHSKVFLNAETTLSYRPLWWYISREVYLEGEAYFEVEPGKKFTVRSLQGETRVLGTAFNIFARKKRYKVICTHGKVEVKSQADKKSILSPGDVVEITPEGTRQYSEKNDTLSTASWRRNKLVFTAEPLHLVFNEIARQYNIQIETPEHLDFTFTGNISTKSDIEHVLKIVCKPFILTFEKVNNSSYRILEN